MTQPVTWLCLTDKSNGLPILLRFDHIVAVVGMEDGSFIELDLNRPLRIFVSEPPGAVIDLIEAITQGGP